MIDDSKGTELTALLAPQMFSRPDAVGSTVLPELEAYAEQNGIHGLTDLYMSGLSVVDRVDPRGLGARLDVFKSLVSNDPDVGDAQASFFTDVGGALQSAGLLFGNASGGLPGSMQGAFDIAPARGLKSYLGGLATTAPTGGHFASDYRARRLEQTAGISEEESQSYAIRTAACTVLTTTAFTMAYGLAVGAATGPLVVVATNAAVAGSGLMAIAICGYLVDKPKSETPDKDAGGNSGGSGGGTTGGAGSAGDGQGGGVTEGEGKGGSNEPAPEDDPEHGETSGDETVVGYPDPSKDGTGGDAVGPKGVTLSKTVNGSVVFKGNAADPGAVAGVGAPSFMFASIVMREQARIEKWTANSLARIPRLPGVPPAHFQLSADENRPVASFTVSVP